MDLQCLVFILVVGGVALGGFLFYKRHLSDEPSSGGGSGGTSSGNSNPDRQ